MSWSTLKCEPTFKKAKTFYFSDGAVNKTISSSWIFISQLFMYKQEYTSKIREIKK